MDVPATTRSKPSRWTRLFSVLLTGIISAGFATIALVVIQLGEAHDSALITACASNISQIEKALADYATRHAGSYPPNLEALRPEHLSDLRCFACPYHAKLSRTAFREKAIIATFLVITLLAFELGLSGTGHLSGGRICLLVLVGFAAALTIGFGAYRPPNPMDYVYAVPPPGSTVPVLMDKAGNHGTYGLNVLTSSGVDAQPPQPNNPYR